MLGAAIVRTSEERAELTLERGVAVWTPEQAGLAELCVGKSADGAGVGRGRSAGGCGLVRSSETRGLNLRSDVLREELGDRRVRLHGQPIGLGARFAEVAFLTLATFDGDFVDGRFAFTPVAFHSQ